MSAATLPGLPQQWELVAEGLNFPTSITFDGQGVPHVAESGLPFAGAPAGGTVLRLNKGGARQTIAAGLRSPVNGLTWHQGWFYVSEGGHPARLSRLSPDGTLTTLVESLPGPGNYHLNMAVVGPDDRLYFSQGAMTNLGIVGLDSYDIGWLKRLPHGHDIPGLTITLTGTNIETDDPTAGKADAVTSTGAFVPFGTSTRAGQRVESAVPSTASVMRCALDGSGLELVAWGLRNAYGLGFLPDGRLLAIDQGADDRGSRPIGNAPDVLFHVRDGDWYGWPDFVAGVPVTDARFTPMRGQSPSFLISNHDELPPPRRPLLEFPPHTAAVKFDAVPGQSSLLVALFGDEAPMTTPSGSSAGRGIAQIDTADWTLRPLVSGDPFHRPIDIRVHDEQVWVLDFGKFEMTPGGVEAEAGSGRLWRVPVSAVTSGSGTPPSTDFEEIGAEENRR